MEQDFDGDGFPDDVEALLNSSPTDGTSTPFGNQPTQAEKLLLLGMKVHLDFTQSGKDSISAKGILPIAAGMQLAGQQVLLDFGGVIKVFNLDAKGHGVLDGKVVFKFSKPKNNSASFTVLLNGNFKQELIDEGLVNSATNLSTQVAVTVLFNKHLLKANQKLVYSAKNGKGKGAGTNK